VASTPSRTPSRSHQAAGRSTSFGSSVRGSGGTQTWCTGPPPWAATIRSTSTSRSLGPPSPPSSAAAAPAALPAAAPPSSGANGATSVTGPRGSSGSSGALPDTSATLKRS
jgi:hypothetical protein